jgi:hypothetical protein
MAFTVQDFRDLARLVEAHPEWRAELRRLVLTEELLALPTTVARLAERMDELREAQRQTEDVLQRLLRRVDMLDTKVGDLAGESLERRYRERAGAYFSRLVRRAYTVPDRELVDTLDDAVDAGLIDDEAREEVLLADAIVQGRHRDDGREVYLVVEVSVGVGPTDVARAVRRAGLLRPIREAVPVVAGEWATREAHETAAAQGVEMIIQRRAFDDTTERQPI